MKLVLATKNRHKVEEIRAGFQTLAVEILSLDNFPEVALKEEGKTLRENALQKARISAHAVGCWALGDDTGLFAEALGGEPGIFSARYSKEGATFEENRNKLLKKMEPVPLEKRGAFFSCVLALVHPDGREVVVEGRLEGMIAQSPKGAEGFGYDPIFFLPERGITLAELTLEEKNRISHRGRALFKMRGMLEGLIKLQKNED